MNRVISMKSSLFLLSLGLLVSRSVNAARRTRVSFERSSLYTCDFDSAPCLTMMVSPGGDLIAQSSHHGGRLSTLWCLESYLPAHVGGIRHRGVRCLNVGASARAVSVP